MSEEITLTASQRLPTADSRSRSVVHSRVTTCCFSSRGRRQVARANASRSVRIGFFQIFIQGRHLVDTP
jgi:hypothetical protein